MISRALTPLKLKIEFFRDLKVENSKFHSFIWYFIIFSTTSSNPCPALLLLLLTPGSPPCSTCPCACSSCSSCPPWWCTVSALCTFCWNGAIITKQCTSSSRDMDREWWHHPSTEDRPRANNGERWHFADFGGGVTSLNFQGGLLQIFKNSILVS